MEQRKETFNTPSSPTVEASDLKSDKCEFDSHGGDWDFDFGKWTIGHYFNPDSINVTLEYHGKRYHRHDSGYDNTSRTVRLGRAIVELEIESGLIKRYDEWASREPILSDWYRKSDLSIWNAFMARMREVARVQKLIPR